MQPSPRSVRLGHNIRTRRKSRRLSADQLAAIVSQLSGTEISGDAILSYEKGARPLTVERLFDLAEALECSTQDLVNGLDRRHGPAPETGREIRLLSAEEHRIFTHIATDWRGDSKALIIANGVYAALPEEYALDSMIGLLSNMTLALSRGEISPADLPAGLPYLEERVGALCVKTGSK